MYDLETLSKVVSEYVVADTAAYETLNKKVIAVVDHADDVYRELTKVLSYPVYTSSALLVGNLISDIDTVIATKVV